MTIEEMKSSLVGQIKKANKVQCGGNCSEQYKIEVQKDGKWVEFKTVSKTIAEELGLIGNKLLCG